MSGWPYQGLPSDEGEEHDCAINLTAAYTHNSQHSLPPSPNFFSSFDTPATLIAFLYFLNIVQVFVHLLHWTQVKFLSSSGPPLAEPPPMS
jgi:hypothetical protein